MGTEKTRILCPICKDDEGKEVLMKREVPFVRLLEDDCKDIDEYEVLAGYFCDWCGSHFHVTMNVETRGPNVSWTQFKEGKKILSW